MFKYEQCAAEGEETSSNYYLNKYMMQIKLRQNAMNITSLKQHKLTMSHHQIHSS